MPLYSKPLVCLPMEVKSRDLDGRLYLAMQLLKEGYPILIGIRARVRRFIRKDMTAPIIYISKGSDAPTPPLRDIIKEKSGYIYLLDEEGAGNLSYNIHVNHPFVLNQGIIDKIFVWGNLQKTYFIQQGGLPEKMLVAGNPRFDLCKPERIVYYRELSKRLNKPSNYILIASNMAWGNQALGKEEYKKQYKRMMEGRHGAVAFDEQKYDYHYGVSRERLLGMVTLAKNIAKAYPDITIVYRPHPSENMTFYEDVFPEENIMLNRKGCSLEWIVDAKAHLHVDCTTGIEAFMVGKEVISYLPSDNPDFLTEAPLTASTVCKTHEAVLERIELALANNGQSVLSDAERQNKIDKLVQLFANFEVNSADLIISTLPDGPPTQKLNCKSLLYRTAKKLRKVLRKNRLNEVEKGTLGKFPGLNIGEMRDRIQALYKMDPSFPEIRLREYDIETFLMEPK